MCRSDAVVKPIMRVVIVATLAALSLLAAGILTGASPKSWQSGGWTPTDSTKRITELSGIAPVASELVIADPAEMMKKSERKDFAGANALTIEASPYGKALRSTPDQSATALYQQIRLAGTALRDVRWSWKVDVIHRSADIRDLEREDFAAKLMFVFGAPSLFDKNIPTLAYVWTSTPIADGSVIQSKRFSSLVYIQLHGTRSVGQWQQEKRDVAEDYRRIFHQEPGELGYIAIFNDNDQTREPASAVFGPITSLR